MRKVTITKKIYDCCQLCRRTIVKIKAKGMCSNCYQFKSKNQPYERQKAVESIF
jgi:hypothetical protein